MAKLSPFVPLCLIILGFLSPKLQLNQNIIIDASARGLASDLPALRGDLEEAQIKVVWRQGSQDRTLKSWYLEELLQWHLVKKRERDPKGGAASDWAGVDLENLVDLGLKGLAIEEKATIDLLILRTLEGGEFLIPRSFIKKYPVLLAFLKNGDYLNVEAPFSSIPPLSSYTQTGMEVYPVQRFFVPAVKEIILTNSHDRFPYAFLTRRSNPAALRGEKVFVKTCMNCHSQAEFPKPSQLAKKAIEAGELFPKQHQKVQGMPELNYKQALGLKAFFKAHLSEKSGLAAAH